MNARNSTLIITLTVIFLSGANQFVSAMPVHTYGKDGFALPIPSPAEPNAKQGKGWMNDAVIKIDDDFTIYDLDVAISLKHTKAFDLQISLRGPAGTHLLLNDYGISDYFDGGDYIGTIFDDEAPGFISDADAPFTGRFKPKPGHQLSIFDGRSTKGTWRLRINDKWFDDTGTFDSFKLIVTIPEPATLILLTFGTAFTTLYRPHPNPKK